MPDLRLVFKFLSGNLVQEMHAMTKRIAAAETEAVRETALEIKTKGRAAIASAGLGPKFQNAFRADIFPKDGIAMHPAASIYLAIPYGEVFEEGATISGEPLLWLPLDNVPLGSSGRPLKPSEYGARLGKLVTINRPGHPPMLGGAITSASVSRVTAKAARLRRKALKAGELQGKIVPLYVGVKSVVDPQKYNLRQIIEAGGDKVVSAFVRKFG